MGEITAKDLEVAGLTFEQIKEGKPEPVKLSQETVAARKAEEERRRKQAATERWLVENEPPRPEGAAGLWTSGPWPLDAKK